MNSTSQLAGDVRKAHVLDKESLERWLSIHIPSFSLPIRDVKQFGFGQSNPTYLFTDQSGASFVLRKKPPGKLLKKAHMVEREYRLMKALGTVGFPVPKMFALCTDTSIIGTTFYVMEFVRGRIFTDPTLPSLAPKERALMYNELVRVLARLHSLSPSDLGLSDYGRKGNYYARQISTWSRQYRASETTRIDAMEKLLQWLPENIPKETGKVQSIVHGDYKMDNVIFHPTEPRIIAVLDWELSTLGHPLSDLAYICMGYHSGQLNGGVKSGIPMEKELMLHYCKHSANDHNYPIRRWHFYVAFTAFRLSSICQGVYKRSLDGNASQKNASSFGMMAKALADGAWAIVEKGEQGSLSAKL